MNYPFFCPKCVNKEIISMPITQYVGTGHMCKKCNTEMTQEVSYLVCGMAIDKSGGFYAKTTI